ncbi:Gfo/Idh/MocA family oxidoreductase [Lachnospiraceae bacterium OttesenSCG-928-D06]|nr:Gfo/Idh/MocA family oxidoreductase [Lachnospiraceae bacterium OttesenSCG-928-D06]
MIKIGMVGVGAISGIYLDNITKMFKEIELLAVCDLVKEKAEKAVEEYKIPKIYDTMEELFADEEIDIVLNLTRPYEHFDVTKAALLAGKHVYSEKPLAATLEEGKALVELANEKELMLGGAPDTFMGAGIQTCRKLIEDGFIGTPVGAAAFMICRGHESWHPDPEFYYKHGGGPMMDMGPYYLTAMVNLLGRIQGVTGVAKKSFNQRTITSQPHAGTVVDVDVSTYVTGILDFENGATGTLFTTFDVHNNGQARFEIYGSEGTLMVPDPNTFGGPIMLLRQEEKEYKEIPLLFDYADNSRGLGLADMAKAIEEKRFMRAGCEQTLHVLEVMTAFERSSESKAYEAIESAYTIQPIMKRSAVKGVLDK